MINKKITTIDGNLDDIEGWEDERAIEMGKSLAEICERFDIKDASSTITNSSRTITVRLSEETKED